MVQKKFKCGLEAALDVAGGKWKALILWHLSEKRRFGELKRLVDGISEKMLIQQLRDLESAGIVARKDYAEVPPRVEYSLTPFGKSLKQALVPLCNWGKKHMKRIGQIPISCNGKSSFGSDADRRSIRELVFNPLVNTKRESSEVAG